MNAARDDAERPFAVQLRYEEFDSDSRQVALLFG